MYKYDLHVHDNACSKCASSTPEEQVRAYAAKGMNGFVSTNHFIHGNTTVSRDLPWKERMLAYYASYERAKAEAEKIGDFTVMFGVEHAYAGGREVLLYGVDIEFLIAHPELRNMRIVEFCDLMKKNGVLCITAHPFRVRPYNDESVKCDPDFVSGVEVFNIGNANDEENAKALEYAKSGNYIMTSGGDIHVSADNHIGKAGIATEYPIHDIYELVETLKSGTYKLIVRDKILSKDELSFR